MSDSERLNEIVNSSKMSIKAFSEHVGMKSPQTLYDILNKKHGISKNVANLIHAKYLNYNLAWILTGEGEKYNASLYENKSFDVEGNSLNNTKEQYKTAQQIDKLMEIMSSQQRTIETMSQTIERLTQKKDGTKCNGNAANSA